jgi:hypothetical protein
VSFHVTVQVDPKELEQLRNDSAKLAALEAAGVDNWEGYSHAMSLYAGEDED